MAAFRAIHRSGSIGYPVINPLFNEAEMAVRQPTHLACVEGRIGEPDWQHLPRRLGTDALNHHSLGVFPCPGQQHSCRDRNVAEKALIPVLGSGNQYLSFTSGKCRQMLLNLGLQLALTFFSGKLTAIRPGKQFFQVMWSALSLSLVISKRLAGGARSQKLAQICHIFVTGKFGGPKCKKGRPVSN